MNKRPSLQFYPGDWWRANDVKGCSMSTQGVWFNFLMAMWDSPEQGKIRDTKQGLARITGSTLEEIELFLKENKEHNFCKVTMCNIKVTVTNRRMYKEFLARTDTKTRVQRHRERVRRESNGNVTPLSSSSTSSSPTKMKESVKKRFVPPTLDEVKKYISDNPELSNIDPEDFFKGYSDGGWIDTQGKPVRNWKLKLRTRSNFARQNNGRVKSGYKKSNVGTGKTGGSIGRDSTKRKPFIR